MFASPYGPYTVCTFTFTLIPNTHPFESCRHTTRLVIHFRYNWQQNTGNLELFPSFVDCWLKVFYGANMTLQAMSTCNLMCILRVHLRVDVLFDLYRLYCNRYELRSPVYL